MAGSNTSEQIGERIKKLREEKGETQAELSKFLSVKRETINQWEHGTRDLKTQYTIALAEHFGVTCDEILRGIKAENVAITERLGLSDSAVDQICKMKNMLLTSTLDSIISDANFFMFLDTISNYRQSLYDKHFAILQGGTVYIEKMAPDRTLEDLYPYGRGIIVDRNFRTFMWECLDASGNLGDDKIELNEYKVWKELQSLLSIFMPGEIFEDVKKDMFNEEYNFDYCRGKKDSEFAKEFYARKKSQALSMFKKNISFYQEELDATDDQQRGEAFEVSDDAKLKLFVKEAARLGMEETEARLEYERYLKDKQRETLIDNNNKQFAAIEKEALDNDGTEENT